MKQKHWSFKVILIFIFIQIQVAMRTGDLKEGSLCETQVIGDEQRIVISKHTERKEKGKYRDTKLRQCQTE